MRNGYRRFFPWQKFFGSHALDAKKNSTPRRTISGTRIGNSYARSAEKGLSTGKPRTSSRRLLDSFFVDETLGIGNNVTETKGRSPEGRWFAFMLSSVNRQGGRDGITYVTIG